MSLEGLAERIRKKVRENMAKKLMDRIDLLIEEQKKTNSYLERIIKLLEERKIAN